MLVRVRVTPDARRERVLEVERDTLSMQIKEPAERNLANKRVRTLVAEHFGVSEKRVSMVSGARSLTKVFSVE
ncbi:MAG: DUF167 domain-containing protein [Patescibacteria group bacterium]|nr:DUF167 domain-containing protein [Patescibacteria group bacterium]MDE1966212.1 DUF167 domain-containing protein [Patescibacteria group bacterium]